MSTAVFVCRKCDGGRGLIRRLEKDDELQVRAVGCQDICSHHVVGIRRTGTIVWFRRIDSKARRKALRRYVRDVQRDRVPKVLRGLTVAKRAGRIRR